ncbi:hypothetical protein TKK_0010630 [Trichogramma kaykai]
MRRRQELAVHVVEVDVEDCSVRLANGNAASSIVAGSNNDVVRDKTNDEDKLEAIELSEIVVESTTTEEDSGSDASSQDKKNQSPRQRSFTRRDYLRRFAELAIACLSLFCCFVVFVRSE